MTVLLTDDADEAALESGEYVLSESQLKYSPNAKPLQYGVDYEIIDKNRDPHAAEIDACKDHIIELLDELHPEGIVYLGQVAAKAVAKIKTKKRIPVLKLLHPAFIARKELKFLTVKKQARKIEKFLEHIGGID